MWGPSRDSFGIEHLHVLDRDSLPPAPPSLKTRILSNLSNAYQYERNYTKYGYEAGISGKDADEAIEKFQARKAKEVAALLVDAGIDELFVPSDSDLANDILRSICEKLFSIMALQSQKIKLTKHPIASVFGKTILMEAISEQIGKSVDETYVNINAYVPYLLRQYNAYVDFFNSDWYRAESRWASRKPWLGGLTHAYFQDERRRGAGKPGEIQMTETEPEPSLNDRTGESAGSTGPAAGEDAIRVMLQDPRMTRGAKHGPLVQSLIVGRAAEFLGGTRRSRCRQGRPAASRSKSRRRKPSGFPRRRRHR